MLSVELSHMIIDPRSLLHIDGSQPMYLPPNWLAFTHPEGKIYFYRSVGLRVVTEAYLFHPEIMDKISSWVRCVEDAFHMKSISPSVTTELFLEPREDLESCGYYMVDHATRTEFWLNQVSTELLEIGQVVSMSHLKVALEDLYWIHVEYFPMHFDCISIDNIEQLISVFSHGQIDRMTSSTSTFPYDVDMCKKFIRLLTDARERDIDGYTKWIVARLWHNIVSDRFMHLHGQDSPRLNSDQSILGTDRSMNHWFFQACTYLSFALSELHCSRFDEIFVDQWVNSGDFCNVFSQCMEDWKSSLSWSLYLLIANVLMFSVPAASQFVGLLAISMCGLSAISAITLCIGDKDFAKATGASAFNRLSALRSETYGFRPAALVFSLPQTLCLWSLILLMAQAALWTLSLVHPSFFVGMAGFVILVSWGTTGHQGISLKDFRHCSTMAENCFGFIQRCGQIMFRRRS